MIPSAAVVISVRKSASVGTEVVIELSGPVDADQTARNKRLIEIFSMIVGKRIMSARGARIWVLITDGVNSRICSSEDGTAMPITAPLFRLEGAISRERHVNMYNAWFKAENQSRPSRSPTRQHLWHVSQVLLEGARNGAYDGLIIIAAEPVAALLKEALAPETRALLIGKVIHDFAGGDPPVAAEPAEMRH